MTSRDLFSQDLRTSEHDITIFSLLLFISLNLFLLSIYSLCRENYAMNPHYLQRTRSIGIVTTLLQISCFGGYWLNLYAMYEVSWIIWLTLSTFCITLMGIRYGQSYIILVSNRYSLTEHNRIPRKYIICTFTFWSIGSCIDVTGTLFGFLGRSQLQSICYALWEVLCCISVGFVIFILHGIRSKFQHLMSAKRIYHSEAKLKKEALRGKGKRIRERSPRKMEIEATRTQTQLTRSIKAIDESATLNVSPAMTPMSFRSPNAASNASSLVSKATTISTSATHSINDSLLSHSDDAMQSEIKRMRNLIIGLCLCICVFLLNAVFNGFFRFYSASDTLFSFDDDAEGDLYTDTPTLIVAAVFFPQWTCVNLFILMFSWVPSSQMERDWDG